MDDDDNKSVMKDDGNEVEDYNEDDSGSGDDDYEKDENIDNDDNGNYYDDDNDDYEKGENNGIDDDDDNLLNFIEQNTLDHWSENVEVDPDDPTLTKEQQLTLFLMKKCRRLINLIRKSSVLSLYFNHLRKILKKKRNVLRDVCTRWNSTYVMLDSLINVRPVLERLYNDKHDLNITSEQIEKLNELELTSTEWNYLNQLHHVLKKFDDATTAISAKHYPSMGLAFFILTKLKSFLTKNKDDNPIVKNLKKLLMGKMNHYFDGNYGQLNLLKVSKDKLCYSYCYYR
jgi:hypothetical protein